MTRFKVPHISDNQAVLLSTQHSLPRILGEYLIARGIHEREDIAKFLDPPRTDLDIASKLPLLSDVARKILEVADEGGSVLVYGDYDADGISAASLLHDVLRTLRIPSNVYLPSRFGEGYGVSSRVLENAKEQGYSLVVTVDCGIGSVDEVRRAKEIGLDIVITDHHPPSDILPDTTIVNPLTEDAWTSENDYNLCGATVAFGLAQELLRLRGKDPEAASDRYLEIIALATIADVMKLVGVNRSLVYHGLDQMWDTTRIGLKALISEMRIESGVRPTVEQMSFGVIPALNACGRMHSPNIALKLFSATNPEEARRLAREIKHLNIMRRGVQDKVFEEAARAAAELKDAPALVLYAEEWHLGVLGIVAAKISELFGKPAVILSSAHGSEGTIHGSARSAENIDISKCLEASSEHLEKFGGHPAAAGIVLSKDKLSEFIPAFLNAVSNYKSPDTEVESYDADALVSLRELADLSIDQLSRLEPFGEGNRAPRFSVAQCSFDNIRTVGRDSTTLIAKLSDESVSVRIVGFRMSHLARRLSPESRYNVLLSVKPDVFKGKRTVRYELIDIEE
ncbi:single-stranded-DNA-specific exonuclease RecJ [bacterium]|nr:single-stranded-DNA-specific exonuclease RecJ [bacterium]